MTTICFDFGNTRLKAAVFSGDNIIEEITINDDSIESIQMLLDKHKPSKTILSSVINHNIEIETVLSNQTKFHKLSATSKLNLPFLLGSQKLLELIDWHYLLELLIFIPIKTI